MRSATETGHTAVAHPLAPARRHGGALRRRGRRLGLRRRHRRVPARPRGSVGVRARARARDPRRRLPRHGRLGGWPAPGAPRRRAGSGGPPACSTSGPATTSASWSAAGSAERRSSTPASPCARSRVGVRRRALAGRARGARTSGPAELAPYFERAERMLGSTPFPDTWDEPTKLAVLRRAAEAIDDTVTRPPINVTFTDGPNAAGVEQRACNLCGDCVSGCNHRAKNTVTENYLPDAVAHGAHIFCEVSVRTVERSPARGPTRPGPSMLRVHRRRPRPVRRPGLVRRSPTSSCSRPARSGRPRSCTARAPVAWPSPPGWASASPATATCSPSPTTCRAARCGASAPAAGRSRPTRRRPLHHRRRRPHGRAHARQGRADRGGRHPGRPAGAHARRVRGGGRHRRRRQPAGVRPARRPAGHLDRRAPPSTPPAGPPTAR